MPRVTIAELQQQLRDTNFKLQVAERAAAQQNEGLEEFKKRVGKVAMEYARDNDWCSTVQSALEDLGVELPSRRVTFTVVTEVTYEVELDAAYEGYGSIDPEQSANEVLNALKDRITVEDNGAIEVFEGIDGSDGVDVRDYNAALITVKDVKFAD